MKISDAVLLLEAVHGRVFTEVYKAFDYADGADLRDYLDFVVHEPAEWMRGFPAKWRTAATFYKPRAAFHKLLKHATIVEDLGVEYCDRIHDVVWRAFKTHGPDILKKRGCATAEDDGSQGGERPVLEIVESMSVESRHSVRRPRKEPEVVQAFPIMAITGNAGTNDVWKRKFDTLYAAYTALLATAEAGDSETDRLRRSAAVLAEALLRS
jgi:hypothetical protein